MLKYIYSEKRVSDDEIVYILDAEGQVLGVKEKMSDLKIKTYNREAPIYSGIILDEKWGPLVSGFSPIKDEKTGEDYGFIGVDFSLQYVEKILGKVKQVITLGQLSHYFTFFHHRLLSFSKKRLIENMPKANRNTNL